MCIFKYVEIGEGRNSTMNSEMKTIWIVGAKGRVGKALMRLLDERQYKLFETDIDDVDITDQESVNSYMRITRPDVVINCAGLTDVKRCEMYPDEAYHVNALGARNLAIEVDAYEAKLIQLSTDDVFGSGLTAVWSEFDHTAPRSVYRGTAGVQPLQEVYDHKKLLGIWDRKGLCFSRAGCGGERWRTESVCK